VIVTLEPSTGYLKKRYLCHRIYTNLGYAAFYTETNLNDIYNLAEIKGLVIL